MLVRSCFLITLIKCLKGHKSQGSLCNVKRKSECVSDRVSESVTRSPIELLWTAKNEWSHSAGPLRFQPKGRLFKSEFEVFKLYFLEYIWENHNMF